MTRRTLDYIFSIGGVFIALMLVVIGFILSDQASFAESYVKQQLGDQKITFAAEERLSEEEKNWKPGSACLVENAGRQVTTGKQAECYANYYIAMHMDRSATNAGYPGETYATMGGVRRTLSADISAAEEAGDSETAAALEEELAAASSLRNTFQTGETLRGLLLTTYGFSIFGDRAEVAGIVCYTAGGLLVLLSIAGFAHALRTPREKLVGTPVREALPVGQGQPAS